MAREAETIFLIRLFFLGKFLPSEVVVLLLLHQISHLQQYREVLRNYILEFEFFLIHPDYSLKSS